VLGPTHLHLPMKHCGISAPVRVFPIGSFISDSGYGSLVLGAL
jgi:hypothetical protein